MRRPVLCINCNNLFLEEHFSEHQAECLRRSSRYTEALRQPPLKVAAGDCGNCRRPLGSSIYAARRTKKSCPHCSKQNRQFHVFYAHPTSFGTSEARQTTATKDGAQSWCCACRSRGDTSGKTTCDQVVLD